MADTRPRPYYKKIEGVLLPGMFKPENIRGVMNYKPTPDDVFIATYPKCGTTWMQNIVLYIFRKGEELRDLSDMHILCPFIDANGLKGIENMPRPGTLKTHLPFSHVPYSPETKYIYVLRNPKDCCVSMYYHTKSIPPHRYADATFDDFFEIFMSGEVEYGDYFDHLMSWYPHLKDKQVFFTTYEDMKKDTKEVVLKLASFLGQEYIQAIEKDNNVLNNVLRFSSFEYMKARNIEAFIHPPKKPEEGRDSIIIEHKKEEEKPKKGGRIDFVRKGIVGDWKNHFSAEQNERMKKKFIDRTQGTEIYDMYKCYMFE